MLTSAIITVIGIALTVLGVLSVMNYFRLSPEVGAMTTSLARGLIFICGGVFCIVNPGWFADVFPVLAIVYGIIILVTGLIKLQWVVDIIRLKKGDWIVPAVGAATSVILAVVILINPFVSVDVMWAFVGAAMIVEAVIDGISTFTKLRDNHSSGGSSSDADSGTSDTEIQITDAE